ncbi:MarR family transcriptional regulator [Amycolatopsis sp. NBC_01488]
MRVGEIADRMQVAGPHVTRHLHVLERRRLVHGLADPDDRRARLVQLTPDGAELAGGTSPPCSAGSARRCPGGPRRTVRRSTVCCCGSPTTSRRSCRPPAKKTDPAPRRAGSRPPARAPGRARRRPPRRTRSTARPGCRWSFRRARRRRGRGSRR